MRCIELRDAFGFSNLHLSERQTPQPGPGEVRIRVSAVSLNYRDVLLVRGAYNPRQRLPLIPTSDGVGTIDAVGEGVSLPLGARVAGCFAPDWIDGAPTHEKLRGALGAARDGMLAEYVVLPAAAVVSVPEHLSDEEASTLPCAAVTAWNGLVALFGVKAGDTVLVQGTGGVSLFALQFARMHGARVIVTSSSDEKLERARALGATEVINYGKDEDWGKTVKTLTGIGADVVVEVGGAATLPQSLRAVRTGGTLLMIGVLSGGAAPVPLTAITMQALRVQGLMVGSKAHFEAMNRAISAHALKPVVDSVSPFEDAPRVLEAMGRGAHFGKLVISLRR